MPGTMPNGLPPGLVMGDNDKKELTPDQIVGILEMYENYQRGRWLGRLVWKIAVALGASAAGIAAFKDHLIQILSTKGG